MRKIRLRKIVDVPWYTTLVSSSHADERGDGEIAHFYDSFWNCLKFIPLRGRERHITIFAESGETRDSNFPINVDEIFVRIYLDILYLSCNNNYYYMKRYQDNFIEFSRYFSFVYYVLFIQNYPEKDGRK